MIPNRNTPRQAAVYLWFLFATLAICYFWSERWLGSDFFYFTDLIYLTAPVIAMITCLRLVGTYGQSSDHGRAFKSIALALIFLLAAELLWIIYEFINISPYPSLADALYLTGYIILLIGFVREWRIGGNRLPKTLWLAVGLVSLIIMIMSFRLTYTPTASTLENFVAFAYNLIDLAVLVSVILVLFNMLAYRGGKLYRPWFWMFIGVLALFTANFLYLYFIDAYESGAWLARQIDLLWIITYLTFTYAFIVIDDILKEVQSRFQTPVPKSE